MSYVNSNPLTECKIADEVSDCWTVIKKRLDTAITYFIPIEIGKQLSAIVTCCQLAKNELYWKIETGTNYWVLFSIQSSKQSIWLSSRY